MCAIPLSDDLRQAAGEPALLFRASEAAWSKRSRQVNARHRVTDGPFLYRLVDGRC